MIYFKRKLHMWLLNYAVEHNIKMYDLIQAVMLNWAKEHGFKCEHRFEEPISYSQRGSRRVAKCVWCGEWVPEERVQPIRYDRLYPDLSDLR